MKPIRRIYIEKKEPYAVEAAHLLTDLRVNLGIHALQGVRILNRYDVAGLDDEAYRRARETVFAEAPLDLVHDESFPLDTDETAFAVEYLPGQYDQRADSAAQCIQLQTMGERPLLTTARVIVLRGTLPAGALERIKAYCINPVDSRAAAMEKPATLEITAPPPAPVEILSGFIGRDAEELAELRRSMGLAMSEEDLAHCQRYFRDEERRDPTVTEIRMLDTYWSDHCRHTTFSTHIERVEFVDGPFTSVLRAAHEEYMQARRAHYGPAAPPVTLMDLAVLTMKKMHAEGRLPDLEVSGENNACSIVVQADVDGRREEWLVMFKNETHNHPTEIEPFGGAATCLGGAIRDPLSGRAYVYQSLRVSGSGDPRTPVERTLPGKLPQRKITVEAARGFSSYGNQVGLATGQVVEIYDEGYIAKRMEVGAVVGAVPRRQVRREAPAPGDVVILLGGRTGRDGIGGATGSSKSHSETSIVTSGAEVQKGNPPLEHMIQRLFRQPDVTTLIKRCNDFGAGGVSVAIGELADGLCIDLDAVPRKYEGLDGTELALSESQERMAVVTAAADAARFVALAGAENLEATPVAVVTADRRLRMKWQGNTIVDISRDFIDTNGVSQRTAVTLPAPAAASPFQPTGGGDPRRRLLETLSDLNVCSQKGLVELFDSVIGAGTVFLPLGGRRQLTRSGCMVAKLPLLQGETTTATAMSFGYHPRLARWSPFHGAVYAVVEAVAKIAACGGDPTAVRLSLQEYFGKPGRDPQRWGAPTAAMLGAFHAQQQLGIAAIGGKDSMSGTFNDLDVPPTLIAFAVGIVDTRRVVSPEFKQTGSSVVLLHAPIDGHGMPDWPQLRRHGAALHSAIAAGRLAAARAVGVAGIAAAAAEMCFGNGIGISFAAGVDSDLLFRPLPGSFVVEVPAGERPEEIFNGCQWRVLGNTVAAEAITLAGQAIPLAEAQQAWESPLEEVFPSRLVQTPPPPPPFTPFSGTPRRTKGPRLARPRVLITVFPGSNAEYDLARSFAEAGAEVETFVFCNRHVRDIEDSIQRMCAGIERSQIIMAPGGFSAGDEPEGSGKFMAAAFRHPRVTEAVRRLLQQRDGLMLGICNGFQAFIKLGLVPYGDIREQAADAPTLTYNSLHYISRLVRTRVVSTLSPWYANRRPGEIQLMPLAHGEGRFIASPEQIAALLGSGQVSTQYVDEQGQPSMDSLANPNGSLGAVEGITSPDGRVLGKMGHDERLGRHCLQNVPGEKSQKLFAAGVDYFR